MKKITKIFLFLIFIFFLIPLASCSKTSDEVDSYTLWNQFNTFLAKIESDGTKEEILNKWMGTDESVKVIDDTYDTPNGTLKYATMSNEGAPFTYYKEGKVVGISADIAHHFAKEYGYKLEISDYSAISSVVADVKANKSDFGGAGVSMTSVREASVCFSNSYYKNDVYFTTLKSNESQYQSLEDIRGLKVASLAGSIFYDFLKDLNLDIIPLEFNTLPDVIAAMRKGDVDGYVGDNFAVKMLLNDAAYSDVTETFLFDYDDYYGFIFPKFGKLAKSEFDDANIGVQSGTNHNEVASKELSNANISEYTSYTDILAALKSGRIDGAVGDKYACYGLLKENKNLYLTKAVLDTNTYAFAASKKKDQTKLNQLSNYIDKIKANGELDEIFDKWLNSDDPQMSVDYTTLSNINGEVSYATDPNIVNFCYYSSGNLVGIEIEIVALFCQEYGYSLTIECMNFDSLIAGVNKFDFIGNTITITEEREEIVNFSSSYCTDECVILAYANNDSNSNIFKSIASSFEKTFIKENRYKMFLQGIGSTLLITISSILLGTIIGFLVYLLCKGGNKIANAINSFCSWLIKGLPVVVLLMILYYVVFGNTKLSGTVVSIIGFTLIFSCSVESMLTNSVAAIDKGQFEGSYALGYSKNKAFFKIILPQASRFFLPSFKDEVVSHIKATAIVGYIAVQDLTKMSDMIRSRTYEAFFPLIATAIIYFILAGILTNIVKGIQIKNDYKRRKPSKILKGVKCHD